jgi:AcrR family transcriptional regulator
MPKEPVTRRTQAERTRASKEKIIQAASAFFAQQGYHGAKMADIAAAANLTEPGLLYHFPSKTHLLTAVLAERDRANRERFVSCRDGESAYPLASLQKLVEYNQTVPGMVQLFTVLAAESIQEEHPGHVFFLQRYRYAREQDVELLKQAQADGDIRSDIPAEDLMVMLYAMMDGLQIQWLYEPDQVDMAGVFEKFIKLIVDS